MSPVSILGIPFTRAAAPVSHQNEHVVQLYDTDALLIDVLSRSISQALLAENPILVVATESHEKQLDRKLIALGFDIGSAILQGRFVTVDASDTVAKLTADGRLDECRFNALIGGISNEAIGAASGRRRCASVFGALVALLRAEGKTKEAVRLEQLWNDLAKRHSFSLLCAMLRFKNADHAGPFREACNEHSTAIPGDKDWELGSNEERLRAVAQWRQKSFVFEQVAALRQAGDQFRLLVEAVQDYAIFMLDPRGFVSTWNVGAERIKQYRASEIIGKHFSCFYPEEDVRNGKPEWGLVTAAREGRFEDEDWRVRKDGSRFWASVTVTALRDSTGRLVGFGKVTRDFTERMLAQKTLQREAAERRDAERQLHISETSLRQLSIHLLQTQDEERKHIGRELHDSLGQYLAVLKMKLDSLSQVIGESAKGATQELAACVRLTEDCIKEVRTVSYLLYPPMLEELGLKSAIPWYLDGFTDRSGVKTTFDVEEDFGRISRESELALFRVLQEGLTNVHRHSGSDTAYVRLSVEDGFCSLEIADKGRGIPVHLPGGPSHDISCAFGAGLRGMTERMRQLGGRLEIVSGASGTTLHAIVPAGEPKPAGCLE